jgi:c-di-GMP-binding flagellar brake protein YcgR
MKKVKERRQFLRIPKESKVTYHELKYPSFESDIRNTSMKNLSAGGVLFRAKEKIDVGIILEIDITAQGWEKHHPGFLKVEATSISKPITAIGEVIRSEEILKNKEYEIAVKFINIYEDDLKALTGYIEKKSEEEKQTDS